MENGTYSLSMHLKTKKKHPFMAHYGSSFNLGKIDIWIELDDLGHLIEDPWIVGVDFIEIIYSLIELAT